LFALTTSLAWPHSVSIGLSLGARLRNQIKVMFKSVANATLDFAVWLEFHPPVGRQARHDSDDGLLRETPESRSPVGASARETADVLCSSSWLQRRPVVHSSRTIEPQPLRRDEPSQRAGVETRADRFHLPPALHYVVAKRAVDRECGVFFSRSGSGAST